MIKIRFLLALCFFAAVMGVGPALRAEIMVEIVNNTGGKAFACFSYHDVISGVKITRGWWDVPAFSSRTIRVNTDSDEFLWYIYNEQGLAWGGQEDGSKSEYRHVVRENFFVKEGWKPRGTKHMRVLMKNVNVTAKKYRIPLDAASATVD